MNYQLADEPIRLRRLTDEEFELANRLAPRSLAICPTCGGKEEYIAAGIKEFHSKTYRHEGEEHVCDCATQIALYQRYLLANIGTHYMRLNWASFAGATAADQWVKDYVAEWQNYLNWGFGLAFASPTQGVGKTWSAIHIGKELIKRGQRVYFVDFVRMIDAFCGEHEEKRQMEHQMRDTTFLILDDIRAGFSERQTDLYALKFEVVIRHRTSNNLPTIWTTNLTKGCFEQEFPRIYSLVAPKQHWVEMTGVDYRKLSNTGEETALRIARGEVAPIT